MQTPLLEIDPQAVIESVRALVREGRPPQTLGDQWLAALHALPARCDALRGGCAHLRLLLQAKRSLLALMQSDDPELQDHLVPIGQQAALQLQRMLRRVQHGHRWRVQRRPYEDSACGEPPLRDHQHAALHVREASARSRPARSGRVYDYADVEPFACSSLRKSSRAALYRRHLEARRLRGCDLWLPNEQALIGQWGLFAATAIPAGTCIGVYGGQLMDYHDLLLARDDRYMITASTETGQAASVSINGENMISLANTLLLLDADGRIAGHPEDGYNIEVAKFPARLSGGWEASVPAMFTLRDIAPGEELRWHYGLANVSVVDGGAVATAVGAS